MDAVLWASTARQVRFDLAGTAAEVLVARLRSRSTAPRDSTSWSSRRSSRAGPGRPALALQQLKERLAAEGLLDPARKRALPFLPRRIGVATSPTGAALRDFLRVLHGRFPGSRSGRAGCRVQGEGAAATVVSALRALCRLRRGRGGGDARRRLGRRSSGSSTTSGWRGSSRPARCRWSARSGTRSTSPSPTWSPTSARPPPRTPPSWWPRCATSWPPRWRRSAGPPGAGRVAGGDRRAGGGAARAPGRAPRPGRTCSRPAPAPGRRPASTGRQGVLATRPARRRAALVGARRQAPAPRAARARSARCGRRRQPRGRLGPGAGTFRRESLRLSGSGGPARARQRREAPVAGLRAGPARRAPRSRQQRGRRRRRGADRAGPGLVRCSA